MAKPTVFISYSHKNEEEKGRLLTHLGVLDQIGEIRSWNDDQMLGGARWRREIKLAMDQAWVAVLLITADFLASDFIMDVEVPRLLERRDKEPSFGWVTLHLPVIPIV